MSDEFEGVIVHRQDEYFTEEALKAQNGKQVPLTLEPGGPVIGKATLRYDSGEKALKADFRVIDPKVADFLGEDPSSFIFKDKERLVPGIRYYTVREEREVKIAAADPQTAIILASKVFDSNSSTGVSDETGRVTSDLRTVSIDAREDI